MNPGANAALSDHVYKDPLPAPKAIVTIAGTEYRVLASLNSASGYQGVKSQRTTRRCPRTHQAGDRSG